MATTCPSGGTLDIFIDPYLPKPLLAVIGESPAARTLIELGRVVTVALDTPFEERVIWPVSR